jgi:hypothetical protein
LPAHKQNKDFFLPSFSQKTFSSFVLKNEEKSKVTFAQIGLSQKIGLREKNGL